MVETIKTIRRRIRSVANTQQITKAMEAVSAAKLRKAQNRLLAARPYAQTLRQLVEHLAQDEATLQHPLFAAREVKHSTLVLVTADRGLCGSFNTHVLKQAEIWLDRHAWQNVSLICIGKKGRDYFQRRGVEIAHCVAPVPEDILVEASREVAELCCKRFLDGETDQVDLLFMHFESLVRFRPRVERFLPLDAAGLTKETASGKANEAVRGNRAPLEYIFEPDAVSVFSALLPRLVQSRLYMAVAESTASEHSARRMAMNNATSNCSELLETLTLQRNKARQTAITTELLDILGGVEALKA